MCVYVCACMRQSEGKHGCCSLSDIHLVTLFLETGLSLTWYSPCSLGQLTCDTCLHLPNIGLQVHTVQFFFNVGFGSQAQVLVL